MKSNEVSIKTCEMHCAGEPVRIVEHGFPKLPPEVAGDVQGCISYLKQNLDRWRRFLMHEPRGHQEMYGVLLLPSSVRDEAQPVIFMHHTDYSPMCGHASLALARYYAEKRVHCGESEAAVLLKVACGLIKTWYINRGPEKGWSKFWSVPAFVEKTNIPLILSSGKAITVDVAFGGGYYAILPSEMVGFQFGVHSVKQLAHLGSEIEEKLNSTLRIVHPTIPEISYIYGVMFIDNEQLPSNDVSKHCAIFAGGQIDRSPCGSGTTARMALLFQKKLAKIGQTVKFHSAVNDSVFTASVKDPMEWQGKSSVIIEIKGRAFYSGQSTFVLEDEDPLGFGFDVE